MQNSFFQKLILVILAGAATAGVYEFYRMFVVGGMESVNPGYTQSSKQKPTPRPTPRRF